jgi:phage terminase large subunit-like protein
MTSVIPQIGSTKAAAPVPDSLDAAKQELFTLLQEQARRKGQNVIDGVFPSTGPLRRELYFKHMDFLAAGTQFRERVVFGGNRSGKSWLGAFETTCHLTGNYPDWWRGKRFTKPITAIACGKDGKVVRDSVQKILVGPRTKFGTGFIPGDRLDIDRCTASRAATGLYDEIPVRHHSGGWSLLRLKSYDQGREAFEAIELDWVWEDEEAPLDIHKENLMRTMTTHGAVINTFTPLKGATPLVMDLKERASEGSVYTVSIWWDDCPHITKAMIEDMQSRYKKHEIRARRYGEAQLGSGAIFTEDDNLLKIRPFAIPPYWPRAYGLDFGWTHPTAAVWGALDRDSDILYLYSEHRRSEAPPAVHASAIQARGAWIPGVSETQGTNMADGSKMFDLYKKHHGLKLRRATKGAGSLESGIMRLQERITQGRLRVFDTMNLWFEEYRAYHRDDKGAVVKRMDDLLDSTRYLEAGIVKYGKTEAESKLELSGGNVVEMRFGARR